MAPGQARGDDRPAKRLRTGQSDNHYGDLEAVQHAQLVGDSLSSPKVSSAIDYLLQSRRLAEAMRKKIEISLKNVKASLDVLPRKKTITVDSPLVRNVLRRVASGVVGSGGMESIFRSEGSKELSVVCRPPAKVNVVGSFLLRYSSSPVVDMAVEMPSDIFQSKDYINYRYHDKRLVYLIYLARHFAKTEETSWVEVSLETSYLNGDKAKPVLSMSHVDCPDVTVRIIPTYSENVFDNFRLAEDRRNVRGAGDSSVVQDRAQATPAYNASILIDSTCVKNLQTLHSAVTIVPAFADAVLIMEAWCVRQRLIKSKFIIACVLADAISKGAAPPRASRDHLLRCGFNSLRSGALKSLRFGGVRVCVGMDKGLVERCALSAAAALQVIESKTSTEDPWFGIMPFLFTAARGAKVIPRPLSSLFDGFVRISVNNGAVQPDDKDVVTVLRRAFVETNRASHIECLETGLFGIVVKSVEESYRKVDSRPSSCSPESFKEFWGEKAGLRRFKDGRIIESLVWSGGLHTMREIGAYVCQRHFGKDVIGRVILGDLEEAAGCDISDPSVGKAIAAFDEFAKQLRSLEGLPLSIRAVHATSPYLRRCGAYSIRPYPKSRFVHPLDVVASFESSGAWPDDPVAISAAKASFYVALRTALAEKGLHSRAIISYLETMLGGFPFRLRIRVDKEKGLLSSDSEDADNLRWETENRALHHDKIKHVGNAMMGSVARLAKRWLNSHLLLSQMGTRCEEFVETLVAAVMSRPEISQRQSTMGYFCMFLHLISEFPWEVCPLAVFLEEADEPMKAPEDSRREEELKRFVSCAQARFDEKLDGVMPFAVYHAWNAQKDDAETWFPKSHAVEQVIAKRIIATARSSLAFIEAHLVTASDAPTLRTIFTTPTDSYDLILDLVPELTPFSPTSLKGLFIAKGGTPLVGLDPVSMLCEELRACLGKYAMFLFEKCSRPQIFAVWRPFAHKSVKFSLSEAPFRRPASDGKSLEPCLDEIIAEVRRIGHGLIQNVRCPEDASGST